MQIQIIKNLPSLNPIKKIPPTPVEKKFQKVILSDHRDKIKQFKSRLFARLFQRGVFFKNLSSLSKLGPKFNFKLNIREKKGKNCCVIKLNKYEVFFLLNVLFWPKILHYFARLFDKGRQCYFSRFNKGKEKRKKIKPTLEEEYGWNTKSPCQEKAKDRRKNKWPSVPRAANRGGSKSPCLV